MSTELLEQAIAATRGVLAGVRSDQMDAATPCESWKVSDLINHIVGGQFFFARMANDDHTESAAIDFSAGDYLSTFDEGCKQSLAAFNAEGALQKTLALPFGNMPAAAFLGIATTDTLCHGWDLARATGQPSDIAPELALGLLENMRPLLPDAFRGPDGKAPFAAEQSAPEGCTGTDTLAAFLGRVV